MRSTRYLELLDSKKGIEELLHALKKKGILFTAADTSRVIQRIAIIAIKLGFKSYLSLLKHLETYPEDWDEIISWLKKGKVYNPEDSTFSSLVNANTITKTTVNSKKTFLRRKTIMFKHQTHNISQDHSLTSKIYNSSKSDRFVGIAEIALGHSGDVLKITALGSCIGLAIYPTSVGNITQRCAVMGHIMLSHSPEKAKKEQRDIGPAKYADKAIPTMINVLEELGYHRKHLEAKMVGGAHMFGSAVFSGNIGEVNAVVCKNILKEFRIPIAAYFTGGGTGMSVIFSVDEYKLIVTPTGGSPIIL